jgi:DeoR/GlpR family transcriptional regulator of sugar metabolism
MLETQRHNLIRDLLEEHGTVSIAMLVDEISASEATLRRDLIKLAEQGDLKQVRGGAVLVHEKDRTIRRRHLAGSAFLGNLEREVAAKRAIAARAVELCCDGEAIIINGGSTTYHMGAFLRGHTLSIMTNSLALGVDLIENSNNRVIFPAGEAHRKLSFILNPLEDVVTDAYRASKYFLSACAVSSRGVMEADPLVARAEQRLATQADEIILLVDATKIGSNSSYAAFDLSQIDKVITDDRVNKDALKMFKKYSVEVLVVQSGVHTNAKRSA